MGDNCGDDRSSSNNNNDNGNDNGNGNGNVRRRRNNYNNNNGSDDQEGNWTNERHSDFLSLMEASFVRTMFHKNCIHKIDNNNNNNNNNHNSRLDRFVPDIAESTLDLPTRNFTSPGVIRVLDPVITQRQRPSARSHHKTSHDQVVPKLKDRAGAKGEN